MKKKLITSALPYVNNEPHLGNIIGCVLSADIYARFCRLKGYDTLYICGTDEYGTATETKALQENLTPKEICDKYHPLHKKIYQYFNISFDAFGRTSDEEHKTTVQEIFQHTYDNGYIKAKTTEQYFSEELDKFLADRLIKGTCPKCNYDDARGDQCDNCSSLLSPLELINPLCSISNTTPILKETKHLYLDLPKLACELKSLQEEAQEKGSWPNNARTTTQSWMKEGLQERAITRDLKWGIQVPLKDYENKVFYVWFDAPLGYVSITKKYFPDTWQDWWFNNQNVELYQFMAKDNIPFHSVLFPAVQLATKQNWTTIHNLASVEYLNYEDTKFSKSKNIGVFGQDVIDSNIDVDLWRFYLLYMRPEKQDTAFSWDDFYAKINNDFIDNIGNLIHRTLTYNFKNFAGEVIECNSKGKEFLKEVSFISKNTLSLLEKMQLKDALKEILKIGRIANKFFQDEEPWVQIKTDKFATNQSLSALIYAIRNIVILLQVYMPKSCTKIKEILNIDNLSFSNLDDFDNLINTKTNASEVLFQKLDIKEIETFKAKFQGSNLPAIEFTIGKITKVDLHPTRKDLYILQVETNRTLQIIANLTKFYNQEELLNKNVIVVTNLKQANFENHISEGMVLCAKKGKKMELLTTDIKQGESFSSQENPALISFQEFKENNLKIEENKLYLNNILVNFNQEIITSSFSKAKVQ